MGRTSLLLVLGFAITLGYVIPGINRMSSNALNNYYDYVKLTQAHNAAVSGANVVASKVFLDYSYRGSMTNIPFAGGTYSTTVAKWSVDTNKIKIDAYGTYLGTSDTVSVIFQPSSFAKFAYYSQVEGAINWASTDTIWGPLHSQDWLTISGTPTFYGKVTTLKGTSPKKTSANFYGGYQAGVSLALPTTLDSTKAAAIAHGKVFTNDTLWLTLAHDTIRYRRTAGGADTVALLSTLAPNGVIAMNGGNVRVKGTLKGRLTILALGSGAGAGNIYIDDDVKYNTDPRTTPSSTDMLGLVVDNNIIITDNTPNHTDVTIQASLFSRTGGLTAENYSTRVYSGAINLLGGVINYQRGAVGIIGGGGSITNGFRKSYRYDDRFLVSAPPFFPMTGSYEIVSWKE